MVKTYQSRRVVNFGSNAVRPYHTLSNLHRAPLRLKQEHVPKTVRQRFPSFYKWIGEEGVVFESSEHAWQSLKAKEKAVFLRFTKDGDLGTANLNSFKMLFPKKDVQKKFDYWMNKDNVGIVAQMAVRSIHAKKLGLAPDGSDLSPDAPLSEEDEGDAWKMILRQKFLQNEALLAVLLGTGNDYLLEFSRHAKQHPSETYWQGMIDDDGVLYGTNRMGNLLMEMREELSGEVRE